jgi:hypothetical protein
MTCRIPAGERVWHGWLIMTTLRHSRWLATLRLVVASLLVLHGSMSAVAMAKMDAGRLSQPAPLELVICTGDGLKTIKLPANGDKPAHENCECECGSLCTSKTPATSAKNHSGTGRAHCRQQCGLLAWCVPVSPERIAGAIRALHERHLPRPEPHQTHLTRLAESLAHAPRGACVLLSIKRKTKL